jgi:hypothetical protein
MRDEPGGVEADEQDRDLNPYHPVQTRRQFGMRLPRVIWSGSFFLRYPTGDAGVPPPRARLERVLSLILMASRWAVDGSARAGAAIRPASI